MPVQEAPCVELGSAPRSLSAGPSPSPSEISTASSPEPQNISAPPLFRLLAMPPPEPEQPAGQDELERRLPGYRRIVIPRELTLIELLKQSSGVSTDEEVLRIREAKLRVIAERVGLRRLHILAPRLRSLTLDGSALSSLRDLGIGLVHLKILSVNRCGLTSLDGVWGLSSLRELHAANNSLQDIQALAALQKLHTLNLADNPIADSSRLWMLAVCGALRRLTLRGTRAADEPDYRDNVAAALPMLTYLDDRPINADSEDEMVLADDGSSSESEAEGEHQMLTTNIQERINDEPGPSSFELDLGSELETLERFKLNPVQFEGQRLHIRRRPATTENAAPRPRELLPPRPKTAHERPVIDERTRLQILNTLMDEEWRCSGSKLTSRGAVCGNLARALRRPSSALPRTSGIERNVDEELVAEGVSCVTRALAEEIPRAPLLADWTRFKEETGIEIDIDFNERPKGGDALSAIERLERIERETKERLNNPKGVIEDFSIGDRSQFGQGISDYDLWKLDNMSSVSLNTQSDIDAMYDEIGLPRTPAESMDSRD